MSADTQSRFYIATCDRNGETIEIESDTFGGFETETAAERALHFAGYVATTNPLVWCATLTTGEDIFARVADMW